MPLPAALIAAAPLIIKGITALSTATATGASIKKASDKAKQDKQDSYSAKFKAMNNESGYGGPSMMGHNPISKHMGGKGAAMCGVKK